MIKAVLIDDERPALKEIEYLLKDNTSIEISGMYTNPLKAVDEIDMLSPHVIFLDVNMPQMKGVDVASRILDRCPETNIVFVTAYDQYAIEAFELHALDYILKPVSKERFNKTIQRIVNKVREASPQKVKKSLIIKTFGSFCAGWSGDEPIKWRTEKTRELFAFLLHHAGRKVSKDVILDAVFYDIDIEKAVHQLHNGIYYIRKTLQEYGVDRNQIAIQGNYILKLDGVEVDSGQFTESLNQTAACPENIEMLESAEAIYTAHYFYDADWAWAETEREKLCKQYMELVVRLSEMYIQNGCFNKAEELLLKAYKMNPYSDNVTKLLLDLYKKTDRRDMALKHYKEYEKVLKKELGTVPPQDVRNMIKGN